MFNFGTTTILLFTVSQLFVGHAVMANAELHNASRSYFDDKRKGFDSPNHTALDASKEFTVAVNQPNVYRDPLNQDSGHYEYGAFIQKYFDSFGNHKFQYTPPHTDLKPTNVSFDPTPTGRQIVDALTHKIAHENPELDLDEARVMAQETIKQAGLSMTANYQIGEMGVIRKEVVALMGSHLRVKDGPNTVDRFYDPFSGDYVERSRPMITKPNKPSQMDKDFARARGLDLYLSTPNGLTWVVTPKGKTLKISNNTIRNEIKQPNNPIIDNNPDDISSTRRSRR